MFARDYAVYKDGYCHEEFNPRETFKINFDVCAAAVCGTAVSAVL